MKLFRKATLIVSIITALLTFSNEAHAQCKSYTKKYCLPSLSPYIHNGQLTSSVFNPGDSAEVELCFNAGKEYRLLVCNQEQIGEVQFKVLDQTRKVLFESDPKSDSPSWDFKVENTQQLIILLVAPKMEKKSRMTKLTPNGCVALLVGFKE